jgi:hypothetical protein
VSLKIQTIAEWIGFMTQDDENTHSPTQNGGFRFRHRTQASPGVSNVPSDGYLGTVCVRSCWYASCDHVEMQFAE